MDRFNEAAAFPLKLKNDGTIDLLAVVGTQTNLLPGSVMLAFLCSEPPQEQATQTIQLALTLVQVRDLQETLRDAELVLQTALNPAGVSH